MFAKNTISVAPMMDYTDRHCRYLHRLISPHVRLYTEMVTARALLHGDNTRLLRFDPSEHPVALQLGGAVPDELARAAELGSNHGYDEINLNVGCPSDRVQSGEFGACLMGEPELVKDCVVAMRERVQVPVTVKTRIGIDNQDDYGFLVQFAEHVMAAGIDTLIVHARKAWLTGLSPKQNRTVPPLDYARVIRLKRDFPSLNVIINGGIERVDEIRRFLDEVDGVMLGRKAYHDPFLLARLDQALHGIQPPSPEEIINDYVEYAAGELEQGTSASLLMRPALGLYAGRPGARHWRRALGELAARKPTPEQLRETIRGLLTRQATAA
ncbi:MAG: tRNA dihydrouridine(20/20a) synthase DusA [Gammaproteobacteria bacterium]